MNVGLRDRAFCERMGMSKFLTDVMVEGFGYEMEFDGPDLSDTVIVQDILKLARAKGFRAVRLICVAFGGLSACGSSWGDLDFSPHTGIQPFCGEGDMRIFHDLSDGEALVLFESLLKAWPDPRDMSVEKKEPGFHETFTTPEV